MKVSPAALKSAPVTGAVLALLAFAALGLAYWSSVQDRERYLHSRNFRLLSDIAEQTQAVLVDADQMIRRAVRETAPCPKDSKSDREECNHVTADVARAWASRVAEKLLPRTGTSVVTAAERSAAPLELWRGQAVMSVSNAPPADSTGRLSRSTLSAIGQANAVRLVWRTPESTESTLTFDVPASGLLSGVLNPARWQRGFSTMGVATPDGRIVYAVGRQESELTAISVASLVASTGEAPAAALTRFATTITRSRVELAGTAYVMLTQPCCRAESISTIDGSTPGLVVIGLADADALRSLSLAISPVLVLAAAALVLACISGWAFLKCWLMGPHQHFARHDVVNLLGSGVFGVSLVTIVLLTVASYARLSASIDARLEQLATDLHQHFSTEVQTATSQLTRLAAAITNDPCVNEPAAPPEPGRLPTDPCQPLADAASPKDPRSPEFNGFSLIDNEGRQAVKATPTVATRQVVVVQQRRYYQRVQSRQGLWQTTTCPRGCYLEYVWSWNTGQPQVMFATPTTVLRLPVAALSVPMTRVLDPVLPPGYEFAIIDGNGVVQLHSDQQRNGLEDLLLETDQNPRLRSLVAAHGKGAFNTSYWGHPYRAFVRPASIAGWSIVVLHGKQATRALVLEWFIVAMLLQATYTAGCVVLLFLLMQHGARWLWPDPLRRHWYAPFAWVAATAVFVWAAVAYSEPVRLTVIIGVVTPVLLWVLAYAVLAVRPPGVGAVTQWTELCRSYRMAGTTLLVATAVLPAASFYALSYDRHIEAFVKERQIALAERLYASACGATQGSQGAAAGPTRYDHAVHDGEVTCVEEKKVETPSEPSEPSFVARVAHAALDDVVPYFTSASISLRELMSMRAGDGLWESRRTSAGTQRVLVRGADPTRRVQVDSALAPALGVHSAGEPPRVVLVSVAAIALLAIAGALAYGMVCFLLKWVLLADVVEPIPSSTRLVTTVGQHTHVVCAAPSRLAPRVNDVQVLHLATMLGGDMTRTPDRLVQEALALARGSRRIAIADLEPAAADSGPAGVALFRRKLEVVERLLDVPTETVLLFTRLSARELADWIRAVFSEEAGESDRWIKLLGRFRVIELPARSTTGAVERRRQYLRALWQGWRDEFENRWLDWRVPLRWRARLLEVEGQSDPVIDTYCRELEDRPEFIAGSLTRDQILEEIEERADQHYRQIWQKRKPKERVVLGHVARHGLASAASRRVVRRLLADGLLRKDPELRLMNESFRRFVLESGRRQEVVRLEQQGGPSLWDWLRVPIAVSATVLMVFLLATQREAFDTTVSMALGVTTAGATLVKLTNLLAQLGGKASDPKPHA